ncbi:regenerating islet-derived protein 4-like [Clavelina lepadiformis]|uniref:C-type lectin domain-containing protein n=1 Tax=Clavelina lepadiformis TaxID=159417 RepID=A0ABP0H3X0_CLALP
MLKMMYFCLVVVFYIGSTSWAHPVALDQNQSNDGQGSGESINQDIRRQLTNEGWYLTGHFAYKLTTERQSWWAGRYACQSMGGELAVHGVRDNALRWEIARELYVGPVWIGLWVGLDDLETDMKWKWTDGSLATDNEIVWSPQEPNGGRRENCGEMWGEDRRFTMNDNPCCDDRYALCERKIVS